MENKNSTFSFADLTKAWTRRKINELTKTNPFQKELVSDEMTLMQFVTYKKLITDYLETSEHIFNINRPMTNELDMGHNVIDNIRWTPTQQSPVTNGKLREYSTQTNITSDSLSVLVNDIPMSLNQKEQNRVNVSISKNINCITFNITSNVDLETYAGKDVCMLCDDMKIAKNFFVPNETVYGFLYVHDTTDDNSWIVPGSILYVDGKLKLKINLRQLISDPNNLIIRGSVFTTTSKHLF